MSIIFIDDILFNDNKEERMIRKGNCVFFLVLNSLSIITGIFYLYLYFIIPYYQNSSNSLSLFLCIFHIILNIFYFLIFLEFYMFKSINLTFLIKIIIMFNPLIIFCIYYWSVCLTHNLYVIYYKYIHNINKRVKFYKYLLFIISLIFYIFTLINIQYHNTEILSKNFGLISNYKKSFIEFFYICGLMMIIYILIKLYYILNKKEDFLSVNESQDNKEKNEKIRKVFNSILTINLSFIIYFLITFTPSNISMLFKYSFFYSNINTYLIDFITIFLISFSGTFIFCIRLLNPFIRTFIVNLLLCNKEFIANYKERLLSKKDLNQSFELDNEIYNIYEDNFSNSNLNKIESIRKTKTIQMNTLSLNFRKDSDSLKNSDKEINRFGITPILSNKRSNIEIYEKKNENDNNTYSIKEMEENFYSDEEEEENKKKESITNKNEKNRIQIEINNIIINEKGKEKEEDKSEYQQEKSESINSYESLDKIRIKKNKKSTKDFLRNFTIIGDTSINQDNKDNSKRSLNSKFMPNLSKKLHLNNSLNNNGRNTTAVFTKKQSAPLNIIKNRKLSRTSQPIVLEEEMPSFDLMNLHLEMNDNLIRLIALSLSINECRMYDDIQEYKQYYDSTIPWNNKDFYTEKTLFKEYNEKTIPTWLGLKNINTSNLEFKILSFCPFVFHHIRLMDNISIDDILSSLDPAKNMKKLKDMKVSGGRGGNSIIYSWDKKFIVKTADDAEIKVLIEKMIIQYHCLMKQSKSLLSRIYGVFKLELKDKGSIEIIIQRNMNDLPIHTKLLTFDLKGSTVDRQSISNEDINLNKDELFNKYKKTVLKDLDLGIIDMKIILNYNDWDILTSTIDSDSMFLQNSEVTDYSLLIFVHKYREEDIENNKNSSRIFASKDKKYIFNFSIVDFLGSFNLEKKGEKFAKELIGYIKKLKDTNFSVLDPHNYGNRFRNFTKRIILDG